MRTNTITTMPAAADIEEALATLSAAMTGVLTQARANLTATTVADPCTKMLYPVSGSAFAQTSGTILPFPYCVLAGAGGAPIWNVCTGKMVE